LFHSLEKPWWPEELQLLLLVKAMIHRFPKAFFEAVAKLLAMRGAWRGPRLRPAPSARVCTLGELIGERAGCSRVEL